jgi:type 1 glutamine amidotransferase
MKRSLLLALLSLISAVTIFGATPPVKPIRIMVITGGHDYKKGQFNQMLASFAPAITFQVAELPAAYNLFLPENRKNYDVLVFYHSWQNITKEQATIFTECISEGKPVVAVHHSICAYDGWPEYWNILGGKYFHKVTTFKGKEYQPCSYIHDVHFNVKIANPKNPITKGVQDFEIFDETYKGYYVENGVIPLLTTDEPSSTPVIGWSKKYGKAKIVVLQSGHDAPTFENPNFRKLLKQSIEWVFKGKK